MSTTKTLYIGIDPSPTATGITGLDYIGKHLRSVVVSEIYVGPELDNISTYFLYAKYDRIIFAIEKGANKRNFAPVVTLAREIERNIKRIFGRSVTVVFVAPSTWRKDMYGRGFGNIGTDAAKAKAINYCKTVLGVEYTDHNEAESRILAEWAQSKDRGREL